MESSLKTSPGESMLFLNEKNGELAGYVFAAKRTRGPVSLPYCPYGTPKGKSLCASWCLAQTSSAHIVDLAYEQQWQRVPPQINTIWGYDLGFVVPTYAHHTIVKAYLRWDMEKRKREGYEGLIVECISVSSYEIFRKLGYTV